MGAVISNWEPPENDEIPLSKENIIEIIGEEYFNEEIFQQLSQGNENVRVIDFKNYINEYLNQNNQDNNNQENNNQEDSIDGSLEESDTFNIEDNKIGLQSVENQNNDQTIVTNNDTKTSTGEDFSESMLQQQTISVMNEDELKDLKSTLIELFQELKNERQFGVYSQQCSHKLIHYHSLLKKYYEQTKESILIDPQDIAEDLIAEYYHIINYDLKSTRHISRFYETESSINFMGIPDIISRRKISRALVNRFLTLTVRHHIHTVEISPSPHSKTSYILTCNSSVKINDDSPRKVMEIFYLQDRTDELKRAKYGPYYIQRQIVVVLDPRPLYHMSETSKPIWNKKNDDNSIIEDELTAEDTGGSSGYPSEEEGRDGDGDDDEEDDEDENDKGKDKHSKEDSSVKSVLLYQRKKATSYDDGMSAGGNYHQDDISIMTSSVYY